MSPEAEIIAQLERIATQLTGIHAELVRLNNAIEPGPGGRSSVTVLDQLCAIADDTSALVNALESRAP